MHRTSAIIYWRNIYRSMRKKPPITVKYTNMDISKVDLREVNAYLDSPMYRALKRWSNEGTNPKLLESKRHTCLVWSSTIGELKLTIVDNTSGRRVVGIRAPLIIQKLIKFKYHNGMGEFLSDLLQDGDTKLEGIVEDNAIVSVIYVTFVGLLLGLSLLISFLLS